MKIVQKSLPALGPVQSARELEEQIDKRYNDNHDDKGLFASGEGGETGGSGKGDEEDKEREGLGRHLTVREQA